MRTERQETSTTVSRDRARRRMPGSEAAIEKDGNHLIVEPLPTPTLLCALSALTPVGEPIPVADDPPPEHVDL